MDYNRGNSSKTNVSVNTKFYTSYDDQSLVTVSAWNTNLSIRFHPLKTVSPNGQKIYAQDLNEVITVSISPDSAYPIIDGIENDILPALQNNEERCDVFMVGSENARKCFSIFTKRNESGILDTYISVSFNLTEEFVDNPQTYLAHKLTSRKYKKNGEFKEIHTDLLHLLDKLKHIDELSQTIQHGILFTTRSKEAVKQQPNRMGGYNNGGYNNTPKYQAMETIATEGSISDFVPFN